MSRVSAKIRTQVQKRAMGICEYCLKPEAFSPYHYHVDHIIPVKKHKGTNDLTNLAWACLDCNSSKSGDIAAYDTITKVLTPLYNPRIQNWSDHFVYQHAVLEGLTAIGRVTIQILQINEFTRVEARQILMEENLW